MLRFSSTVYYTNYDHWNDYFSFGGHPFPCSKRYHCYIMKRTDSSLWSMACCVSQYRCICNLESCFNRLFIEPSRPYIAENFLEDDKSLLCTIFHFSICRNHNQHVSKLGVECLYEKENHHRINFYHCNWSIYWI